MKIFRLYFYSKREASVMIIIINSNNAQHTVQPLHNTTVQSSYEWAMNRRWVLWLSLAERCYYNIISPLIGQNLPSDASDWLTRLLTRNSVTLGECELCIVSSTANRDNGAQRSERRGRAASPASGSSHNSAVSVSIKTSMQRYFAQVFYVF